MKKSAILMTLVFFGTVAHASLPDFRCRCWNVPHLSEYRLMKEGLLKEHIYGQFPYRDAESQAKALSQCEELRSYYYKCK